MCDRNIHKTRFLVSAHRVSWEIHFGPIPDGMCVLHKCDVPNCINPRHLFLGTKMDNAKDMIKKGRQKKGALLPQAKLNEESVLEIRNSTQTQKELAKKFGVSQTAISFAKNRLRWSHV
jgi:HNH endonuclease